MDKTVTEKLMKSFPAEAIKKRQGGGGKMLDYIEGHTVIRRMIESTGNQYDMQYIDHFMHDNKFFLILSVSVDGLGTRLGLGVANMSGGEDVLKGAITDAYKNAVKYFGVGLDLYGEDYEKPKPIPPKQQLSQLLAGNGIKSKKAANEAAQERFGKDLDNLTESDVLLWIDVLSAAPVAA